MIDIKFILTAHKCNLCDKTFSIKSALKVHLLTHTKVNYVFVYFELTV
jgi:uncharacterized Zn-finger protein